MGLVIKSDSLKNIDLLGFGSGKSAAQTNKIFPYDEGFITSSDVYALVNKIANAGSSIDWKLTKQIGDKTEEVRDGYLFDKINNPNINHTREEFVYLALTHILLSGEMFGYKKTNIGFEDKPVGLYLWNPQLVEVVVDQIQNDYVLRSFRYNGSIKDTEKESVSFVKYGNPSLYGVKTLRGLSPLIAGYLTLQGLNNNQAANAAILENQGVAGILSNEGEVVLTASERDQAQGVLDKLIAGVRNFGKVLQSSGKVKYTRLGLDPSQLQLIESKVLKVRDLCNIYNVNSSLMNDPANKIYNNVKEAKKEFWTEAVIPNTQLVVNMFYEAMVEDFNKMEFPNGEGKYSIELKTENVQALQEDKLREAQKDKIKMEGVGNILAMPISFEGKVELLISEYGYTEENAKIIAKPAPIQADGNTD